MCKPRLLRAEEIDCRVQRVNKNSCTLLLYKDARCDMAILDETFGEMNWQRSHTFKNGCNYCTVSVYDSERKEWISREDIGTPSYTEKEKGEASDAFKRACVNFGIGRELYTAPDIWIRLDDKEVETKNDKHSLAWDVKFRVAEIYYFNREICGLTIVDQVGKERYSFGDDIATGVKQISEAVDEQALKQVWKNWNKISHPALLVACKQRMQELNINK